MHKDKTLRRLRDLTYKIKTCLGYFRASAFTSLRTKHEPHFSLPSLTASLLCSFSLIPVIRRYLCSPRAGWNRATAFKIHLDVLSVREKLRREKGIHGKRRSGKLPCFSLLPPGRTDPSANALCAFYTYILC